MENIEIKTANPGDEYEKLEFKPSGKTKIFRGAVEMMYCRSFV